MSIEADILLERLLDDIELSCNKKRAINFMQKLLEQQYCENDRTSIMINARIIRIKKEIAQTKKRALEGLLKTICHRGIINKY